MGSPYRCTNQLTSRSANSCCTFAFRNRNCLPNSHNVQETKSHQSRRYHEVWMVRLIGEVVTLVVHPRQQLKKSAFVIHFFPAAYKWKFALLDNKTTAKSAVTTPVIRAFGPFCNKIVIAFAKTAPLLQRIAVSQHSATAANVRTCRVLLKIFEHRKRR